MKLLVLIVALAAAAQTKPSTRPGGEITPPPRRDVPGKRIQLTRGELFIPDFFRADPAQADLVIWFHGAAWCAEQVFYDARRNAVLLATNAATLKRGFAKPAEFLDLLKEVSNALRDAGTTERELSRIALVSFSGGWTSVRDVLSHPELARDIDEVVLLDSLYARDEQSLMPFVDFARRARDGEARFVFTQLYPPLEEHRRNATTVNAMKLIGRLQLVREAASGKVLYRASKGNALILGISGMTNQDHFDHFYNAADVLKR